MKLALLFALGSTTAVSALFPIGASASQEVACFYESGTTSGSFLLKVGKLQAHIDVEEIADDVEEEMLDGDGVEQESGFDAIAWVNSFLEKGLVKKGYLAVAEHKVVSGGEVHMTVAEILDGRIVSLTSIDRSMKQMQESQVLGRLTCRIR